MRKTARALIIKDKKILLVSGYGTDYYWTPGGGIELGETPENALNRELKEELNIKASVNELFTSYTFENQDVSNYLVAAPKNIRPSAEIDKIYWASKNDIENDVIKVSRGFSDNAFATLVDSHLL